MGGLLLPLYHYTLFLILLYFELSFTYFCLPTSSSTSPSLPLYLYLFISTSLSLLSISAPTQLYIDYQGKKKAFSFVPFLSSSSTSDAPPDKPDDTPPVPSNHVIPALLLRLLTSSIWSVIVMWEPPRRIEIQKDHVVIILTISTIFCLCHFYG